MNTIGLNLESEFYLPWFNLDSGSYGLECTWYTFFMMHFKFKCFDQRLDVSNILIRSVIGEIWYSFLRIFAPIPYNTIFILHAHAPALAPIKIGFGAMQCGVGAILRFGLDSIGSNWASSNVNFNLKNLPLQQLKNLANYSIQI